MFKISKYTIKNWIISTYLILRYGASDLRFKSKREFLIYVWFCRKLRLNWKFRIAEYGDFIGDKFYLDHYGFSGGTDSGKLFKHEEER